MSGYTPLYDTMLTGTLYGRWPHTGIWACLLSRVSREGVIDETPQSLAGAIGVSVELLMQCIEDFMKPDPNSRTPDHEGRRLALIDPKRSWGWIVLNNGKYKEKARKKNFDQARTEDGSDAQRKRNERITVTASRRVPRSPAKSRRVPLSESESKEEIKGLNLEAWKRWENYRQSIGKPIKPQSMVAAQRKLVGFGTSQAAVVENSIAEGYTGLFPVKSIGKPNGRDPYAGSI